MSTDVFPPDACAPSSWRDGVWLISEGVPYFYETSEEFADQVRRCAAGLPLAIRVDHRRDGKVEIIYRRPQERNYDFLGRAVGFLRLHDKPQ